MPVTRDDVIWGFRIILGRDPESEEAVAAQSGHSGNLGQNDGRGASG